jgi:hypothetical protein
VQLSVFISGQDLSAFICGQAVVVTGVTGFQPDSGILSREGLSHIQFRRINGDSAAAVAEDREEGDQADA